MFQIYQSRLLRPLITFFALVSLLSVLSFALAFDALGDEFMVNTSTNRWQILPSIAMHTDGSFVITWESDHLGQNNWDIYAQRFDANGNRLGGEFTVNTLVNTFTQQNPMIDMDSAGNFVIAWAGSSTGETNEIYARRYNAAGVPQGDEILVTSVVSTNQIDPSIAVDADGDFVITWVRMPIPIQPTSIYARRYNAAGIAQGDVFQVNNTTTNQSWGRVAMDAAGNFIVTWQINISASNQDVYAQRYNTAGIPQGTAFLVTTTTGIQGYPSIAAHGSGTFVITWQQTIGGSAFSQYAQRYNAAGVAIGGEFQVSAGAGQGWIAMNSSGAFVIVTNTGATKRLFARRFNADATPQSDEFSLSPNVGDAPQVEMDTYGNFTAVWMRGGEYDVFARRFGDPIPPSPDFTENDFFAAFEQERAAYPAIAQGIADFVPNGINMTVTLNTGEVGRVNFTIANADGFVTIQIASITSLSGGAASQNYVDVINRDLPTLLTAALDNILVARFGSTQNVEGISIDNSTMTLTVVES